jgi:hypothetical protein
MTDVDLELRALMPPREAWPVVEPARVRVTLKYARPAYGTLLPWTRSWGRWWSFSRRLHVPWSYQEGLVARVYLNGQGRDPELRFQVHDLREFIGEDRFRIGASNSFCRVTPSLETALGAKARDLGPRGLWQPRAEDVLVVMRWCDDILHQLYVEGIANEDAVPPFAPREKWTSPKGGFLGALDELFGDLPSNDKVNP